MTTNALDATPRPAATPPYDVVILYYRHGPGVGQTIEAVLGQSVPPSRVLLYDNGSGDGVVASIVTADPRLEVLKSTTNLGYAGGMNAAAKHLHTDSEFILFLTHEVRLDPDAAEHMLSLAVREGAAIVGPSLSLPSGVLWSQGGDIDWRGRPTHRRAEVAREFDRVAWLDGCALLTRTKSFEATGGFDERLFLYWDDVDICDRLSESGPVLVCHRAHATQDTGTTPVYFGTRNRILFWSVRKRRVLVLIAVLETLAKLALDVVSQRNFRRAAARLEGLRDGVLRRLQTDPSMIRDRHSM